MGSFGKELVLFSPVNGVVLEGGKPVPGATVTRMLQWKELNMEDQVTTSDAGEFSFSAKTVKSMLWRIIPHNPVIMQSIVVHVGEKPFKAWKFQKGNYKLNSESDGRAFRVRCDIQDPARSHDINDLFSYFGICTLQ